jgi:hypothetical protein
LRIIGSDINAALNLGESNQVNSKITSIGRKVFLLFLLFAQGAFAEVSVQALGIPVIRTQTPYWKVRQIMLKHGWLPFHGSKALPCSPDDQKRQGRPEMQACSDVGSGQCTWLWKKNGRVIVITTQDDDLFQEATPFYGK